MLLKKKNNFEFSVETLRRKIAENVKAGVGGSLDSLEKFLVHWWCNYYHRPYKDPLVMSYTLEELMCEYFDIQLRNNPEKLKEALNDGVVEEDEDEKWLKEMEETHKPKTPDGNDSEIHQTFEIEDFS